jgi:hypothetical protein
LRANPEIAEVAPSNGVPFDLFNVSNIPVQIQGKSQAFTAHIVDMSPEFPSLYGMRLLAGRLLSSAHGQDVFTSYPFYAPSPDYYLHHWLEGYAYRIWLNPLYFLGAGAAALMIAWITIFAHALRVARSSPIRALRYE